jgi:hypothetical protein
VFFRARVPEDGDASPVVESVIEGQGASSAHEDLGSKFSPLSALLGDGRDATEASEGLEIAESNGVVGVAEQGGEHESPDTG